jgi:hypothetical protein
MGCIDMPVCICSVQFRQKLKQQLFLRLTSAFECSLNVNPRYQTEANSVAIKNDQWLNDTPCGAMF